MRTAHPGDDAVRPSISPPPGPLASSAALDLTPRRPLRERARAGRPGRCTWVARAPSRAPRVGDLRHAPGGGRQHGLAPLSSRAHRGGARRHPRARRGGAGCPVRLVFGSARARPVAPGGNIADLLDQRRVRLRRPHLGQLSGARMVTGSGDLRRLAIEKESLAEPRRATRHLHGPTLTRTRSASAGKAPEGERRQVHLAVSSCRGASSALREEARGTVATPATHQLTPATRTGPRVTPPTRARTTPPATPPR